ncbi:hypothetical protein QQF64_023269 [Cirrhinus molitorella]|uniref:Uncharacterized protein n=1 Tax=Cirrhinus molitorella TaxID=172907 RepID=A0ABR3L8P3_9TELE
MYPIASVLNIWEPWLSLMTTGKERSTELSVKITRVWFPPQPGLLWPGAADHMANFTFFRVSVDCHLGNLPMIPSMRGGGLTLEYYQTFGLDLPEQTCDSLIFAWTP